MRKAERQNAKEIQRAVNTVKERGECATSCCPAVRLQGAVSEHICLWRRSILKISHS